MAAARKVTTRNIDLIEELQLLSSLCPASQLVVWQFLIPLKLKLPGPLEDSLSLEQDWSNHAKQIERGARG